MRILITNDDGVLAPGLMALRRALSSLGDVYVVAPERPRSGAGHAITLHKPLRLTETTLADGAPAWAASGTPSDCVTLALSAILDHRCDLVVSGINDGPNLGWDVTYSGTVAAAMEGAIFGVPSIAVSLCREPDEPSCFDVAAETAWRVARYVGQTGLPPHVLLNINVPNQLAPGAPRLVVTCQGTRQYNDRIDERVDPWGKPYYWITGSPANEPNDPESDVLVVQRGLISVTPIHLDLTAHHMRDVMKTWRW